MTKKNVEDIAANKVLSVAEGIELHKSIKAQAAGPQWHWMGNYGDVYGPANVANQAGVPPGGLIININFSNGLVAAWMFY
jgi:hypothetical protein